MSIREDRRTTLAWLFYFYTDRDGPDEVLVQADSTCTAELVKKLADFSVLVEPGGRILAILSVSEELRTTVEEGWKDSSWLDGLNESDRELAESTIALALKSPGEVFRCDLNHTLPGNTELPAQYHCVAKGHGEILIAALDLRPAQSLRQQLHNTQRALEQDYWRLKQVETRYKSVFDMVSDAIIVIDEATNRILEANPVANGLLGESISIVGKPFPIGLDKESTKVASKLFKSAIGGVRENTATVQSESKAIKLSINVSFLSQDGDSRYLVRMTPVEKSTSNWNTLREKTIPSDLENASDAILFTSAEGQILAANRSFLSLAQLMSEDQVLGKPANQWLGRSAVDMNVLFSNLRQSDDVKLFVSTLRGESGMFSDVEISGFKLSNTDKPMIGLFIRDVGRRVNSQNATTHKLPNSIEEITRRVGRVPLKQLVKESKQAIEALCIESALKLTRNNRASAAELLGLSRQSLYAKLREHGIADTR